LHVRKRGGGREPYPARTPGLRAVDALVYTAGILAPVMTLPQIYLIFSTRNASGVSAEAWLAWALLDVPWILYGVVHRERPLVVTYTLWFLGNFLVFVGAVLY